MSRILITDGEQRAALALVRSLGRAGHTVFVCSSRPRSLAGASRYCRAQAAVPDALREPDACRRAVSRLLSHWQVEVLLPVTEPTLLALLPARSEWPGVQLPFPDLDTFRRMADKAEVLRTAGDVGIAVPQQRPLCSQADLDALIARGIEFPVVIKPSRSVSDTGGRQAKWDVTHAADVDQLKRRIHDYPAPAYPLLIQRRILGPGVGIFALLWDGEPRALFAHRRIREKPPSGGVSVYRESIAIDPSLAAASIALLRRLEWQGVAMVEYKVEAATGTPFLMEINGRFWGSLQLAIDAGVDFPVLLLEACAGRNPDPVSTYREGTRSRWFWGDVDHLLTRLRRSAAALDLPPDAPGRMAAIREFFRLRPSVDRNEILRSSDPVPFLRESLDWIRNR